MSILTRLLQKRGMKDASELSEEEKVTFDGWRATLAKDDISLNDVEMFCTSNLRIIEDQFKDLANSKEKIERLVLLHSVYSSLKGIINSPRLEKENLEKYLQSLL